MDENLTEIINDWLISIHKLKLENSKKNDNFELENFKKDWTLVLKKIGSFMSDIYMRTATYYHNFQGRGTITLRYLKFEPIPTDITPCFKDIIIEKIKVIQYRPLRNYIWRLNFCFWQT